MGIEPGRRSSLRSWLGVLLTAIVVVAVGACSSDSPDDSHDAGADTSTTVADAATTRLPIEAVLYPGDEAASALARAHAAVLADCMSDRGFPLPPAFTEIPPASSPFDPAQRYGALDVDRAQRFGYHNPDAATAARQLQEEQESNGSLPAGFTAAMQGQAVTEDNGDIHPDGTGCLSIADSAIYGGAGGLQGLDEYQSLLQVQIDSFPMAQADDRVIAVEQAWSDCMLERGFRYTSSAGPRDQFTTAPEDTTPPTDAERATAVADAECQAETDLVGTYLSVESGVQEELLQGKEDAIRTLQDEIHDDIDHARDVLDD